MSNPTVRFNWAFPTESSEPWYTAFDTFATAIDLTVFSVSQQPLPPHCTLVLSRLIVGDSQGLVVSSTGGSDWRTMSDGENGGGAWVGSFAIATSGSKALVDFSYGVRMWDIGTTTIRAFAPSASTGLTFYTRGVINPGSITVPDPGQVNQVGRAINDTSALHLRVVSVVSLGTGNYSLALERLFIRGATAGLCSMAQVRGPAYCVVTEVRS